MSEWILSGSAPAGTRPCGKENPRSRMGRGGAVCAAPASAADGFTLIELLTVMTIIVVVLTFVVPAFTSMVNGTNLNRAGQLVADQCKFAEQEAVTKNRDVQVRFYKLNDGTAANWRGIQVFRVESTASGSTVVPITNVAVMPVGIMINADATLSPLLTVDTTLAGTMSLPAYGNVQYAGFRFRANGVPDSVVTDAKNFVTLNNVSATGNPPANYYTVQINSLTGKVITFRP